MIKSLKKWLEYTLDLAEVAYPSSVRIYLSFDIKRYSERVAVKTSTFVSLRHMRQTVRRLECKLFEYFHVVVSLGQASRAEGGYFIFFSSWQVPLSEHRSLLGFDWWLPPKGSPFGHVSLTLLCP